MKKRIPALFTVILLAEVVLDLNDLIK